jgi:hypothetical protein
MALEQRDLDSIDRLLKSHLEPIRKNIDKIEMDIVSMRKDIDEMKGDLSLLARLNQLDEIRKDARLRVLYTSDTKEA